MATNQIRPVDLTIPTVTRTAQDVLREWSTEDLLIGIPATVMGVDNYESQQVIDVTPDINDVYSDGRVVSAIILKSVFVKLPHGNNFSVTLPIAVGDKVTLHYSHREISKYLDGTGNPLDVLINPASSRDCWATHGFGTRNSNQSPSATDFVVKSNKTTITITQAGKLTITTADEAYLSASKYTIDTNVEITGTLLVGGNVTHSSDVNTSGATTSNTVSAGTVSATTSLTVAGAEVYLHDHNGNVPPFM